MKYMTISAKAVFVSGAMLFLGVNVDAQKKSDRKTIKILKEDIGYLASDELEGRRTGSEGEKKAAEYIQQRYKKSDIAPYKGKYIYPFTFTTGRQVQKATIFRVNNRVINMPDEGFPMAFSANKKVYSEIQPDILEQGNIWMMPLYKEQADAKDAHYDWEKNAYERAKDAAKQGASGVLFYDNYGAKFAPEYNAKSEHEALDIPVAYISYKAYQDYITESQRSGIHDMPVEMNVSIQKEEMTGSNIAAYIDNGAKYTVVLGAHYDHLGHGEDGTSLNAKKDKQIHNGADDNASGTAALIQLAEWIKKGKLKNYNYMFINFSGEELGLLGSKAIVKDMGLDSNHIAYMINMDMVGRLNDSTHALTVGGYGTSPVWPKVVDRNAKEFKIVIDSSGVGPSDHSSFYYANVPVLFFFTGLHTDYHKPGDDANKINYTGQNEVMKYIYNVVKNMDKQPKPMFTKTKQTTVGKVRFKVTLGIMPDYSYQEGGVRADGVTDGKPAQVAGIKGGDIITQVGEYKVNGMQSYMEALSHFAENDTAQVTVLRDGKPMQFTVTFK
jgi:hypothetical protein